MSYPSGEYRIFARSDDRGRPTPSPWELKEYFSGFGEVLDIYKPPSAVDVAYVTFGSQEEIQLALLEPKPTVGGIILFLQQAQPRGSGGPGGGAARQTTALANPASLGLTPGPFAGGHLTGGPLTGGPLTGAAPLAATAAAVGPPRVYVTGLVDGVDEDTLNAYFVQFGLVKDVYIPVDKVTGHKKPFAFVTMSSFEDTNAILSVPSHYLGENVVVNVTAAEPRQSDLPRGAAAPAVAGGLAGGLLAGCGAGSGLAAAPPLTGPLFDGTAARACAAAGYGGGGQVSAAAHSQLLLQQQESPKQGVPGIWRLFVYGMPAGLNGDMLRGHFARHGEILDIYVPPKTPDLAYITFSQQAELQDALLNSGLRIAGYTVQGLKAAEPRDSVRGGAGRVGGKGVGRPGPY